MCRCCSWVSVLCHPKVKWNHFEIKPLSLAGAVLLATLSQRDLMAEFGACRMYYSSGAWNRPPNSHAALLDKYWIKLQMGTMGREELKKVNAFENRPLALGEAKERRRLSVAACWQLIDGLVWTAQRHAHLLGWVPSPSEVVLGHIRACAVQLLRRLRADFSGSVQTTLGPPAVCVGPHHQVRSADSGVGPSPGYLLPAHRAAAAAAAAGGQR